ncbi:MAG: TolC family protein [Melioribacteraceae bacterium]|nr:TolC family protein [Melioribacteraceae bacterium]
MKTIFKSLIILIFSAAAIFAQEVKEITLEECVKLAIENNHLHKQALLNREKAIEQETEAFGLSVLPHISGTVNYTNAIERAKMTIDFGGRTQTFSMGSKNTFTTGVSLEQPLFSGALFLATKIAETYAEVTDRAAQYSEDDLVLKVRDAYYTYLLADSFVKLADHQIKRAKENLDDSKVMYDAGMVSEYDYIRANVTYQNLIPEKTGAVNQKKQAMNNLKLVMGSDLNTQYSISDSLIFAEKELPNYVAGLDTIYIKNNLIQQMELQSELQDLNASYEWTKHLPEVQAFGNWQVQAFDDTFAPADWEYYNSLNVGISIKVPIFKGFATSSKVEQAKIDHKISIENLVNTKETVKNNYVNVLLQINKSGEQISAYTVAMSQAERGYQISLKRFNTGLGTQLEVTDAQGALISSQVNYLQSVYDYLLNHARLDLLLGNKYTEIDFNLN